MKDAVRAAHLVTRDVLFRRPAGTTRAPGVRARGRARRAQQSERKPAHRRPQRARKRAAPRGAARRAHLKEAAPLGGGRMSRRAITFSCCRWDSSRTSLRGGAGAGTRHGRRVGGCSLRVEPAAAQGRRSLLLLLRLPPLPLPLPLAHAAAAAAAAFTPSRMLLLLLLLLLPGAPSTLPPHKNT
jgi:hypothetical protein